MPWTTLLLLTIFVLPVPASAIIYQCRDDQGTLFLTDDPDNLPPGCKDRQTRLQKKDLEPPSSATPAPPAATPPQKRAPADEKTEDEEKSPQPSGQRGDAR